MSQSGSNPSLEDLAVENAQLRRQIAELMERLEFAEPTVQAIRDGEVDAVVVDCQDDTRVFTFTAAEHVQLELAQEVAGVGTWNWDVVSGKVALSETLKSQLQFASNAHPTIADLWALVHPDDRLPVLRTMRHHLKSPPDDYYNEFRVTLPGGEVKWVVLKGRVIRGTSDKPLRVVGINFDITERKAVEDELQRRGMALQESDRRKDQFLATLAHELRNPLSSLSVAAELLALKPSNQSDHKELVELIGRQCDQLKRLIDDLMDVSRISTGKLSLQKVPVQLSEAISAALEISRPVIEDACHELRVLQPDQPLVIDGDLVRLAQIIANLLINAAKYTPAGGRIELEATTNGSQVEICVRDDGIGLAPETLEKIFGLFMQIDSSVTRSQGGLGIGLTLVKTLVDLHGGSVEARSAGPGMGSEFTVRLPLCLETERGSHEFQDPSGDGGAPLHGFRILVVDDNAAASEVLKRMLEELGQDARTAHSAKHALELIPKFQPDAVISDIAMPGVSGYQLAAEIRQSALERQPFLIALTGYGQALDRQEALAAGFDEHMVKPINLASARSLLASLPLPRRP